MENAMREYVSQPVPGTDLVRVHCPDCGSVVADVVAHDAFHDGLATSR